MLKWVAGKTMGSDGRGGEKPGAWEKKGPPRMHRGHRSKKFLD